MEHMCIPFWCVVSSQFPLTLPCPHLPCCTASTIDSSQVTKILQKNARSLQRQDGKSLLRTLGDAEQLQGPRAQQFPFKIVGVIKDLHVYCYAYIYCCCGKD